MTVFAAGRVVPGTELAQILITQSLVNTPRNLVERSCHSFTCKKKCLKKGQWITVKQETSTSVKTSTNYKIHCFQSMKVSLMSLKFKARILKSGLTLNLGLSLV